MNKKLAVLAVVCTILVILGGINTTLLYGTQYITSKSGYSYSVSVGVDWWNCNWSYCKKITIDHTKVQSNQTDFPVLIYESADAELAAYAQFDGDDIVFVDRYNSTQYKHEIEEYNSSTGELTAWVKVSSLSSTEDTILYMYYGNPSCSSQADITNTWDSNFKMVQHLNESTGSTLQDSTSNDNDGTNNGAEDNTSSKIDGGYDFDSGDNITIGTSGSLNITSQITLEGWVKDPPLLGIEQQQQSNNDVTIVDKRDEQLPVIPGEQFIVERIVSSDEDADVVFVALFSSGVILKDMNLDGKSVFAGVYTADRPGSKEELEIEEIRKKLPDKLKELGIVAYSKPFKLQDETTVQMQFDTEDGYNLLSDDDRISYLVFSDDGFDFEGTTHLSSPVVLIDWLNPFSIFEAILDVIIGEESSDTPPDDVSDPSYTNITVDQAKEMIDAAPCSCQNDTSSPCGCQNDTSLSSCCQDIIILDVQTPEEYDAGHINGALSIPLIDLGCDSCLQKMLDEHKNDSIIVYGSNDEEGRQACEILVESGYTSIYYLEGGITAWKDAGFSITDIFDENPLSPRINSILEENRSVFLFFYTETCGYCQNQMPIIDELNETYSDNIEIIYVNKTDNPKAFNDFDVTGYPTMFLVVGKDEDGYIYKDFSGFKDKDMLVSFFDMALDKSNYSAVFESWWHGTIETHRPLGLPLKVAAKISHDEDAQVIIQYNEGTDFTAETSYLEALGFVPTTEIPSKRFVAGTMNKSFYEEIKFDNDIFAVYPDGNFTVLLDESLPLIRFDEVVEDFGVTGKSKKICIIDTGVDSSVVNFSYGYDFVNDDPIPDDEHGHGTKVAAVIKSIAPDSELIVAKVINASGKGYESDVLEGLQWCIDQRPDIISFSIGTTGSSTGFCDMNFVASMSNDAVDNGVFVIAASGNDGLNRLKSPACGSYVFSVGATDDNDVITSFSNVHPILDMFAPGKDITTIAGSGNGTSFSAPHIAGAVALLLEQEALDPAELKYRLRSTGKPIQYTYNESSGVINISRLDIYNALTDNKIMEPYNYSEWWQDNNLVEGEYEPQPPVCFMPDTPINMADGTYKQIKDVKVGEWVKVFDEERGIVEDAPVTSIQTKMHINVHELYLENGKMLRPSANHPFFTKEKGWATIDGLDELGMDAGKLEIGDHVYSLTADGELEEIKITDIIPIEGNYLTYNFVDMKHGTYLADDIVTHNTICVMPDTPINMADGTHKAIKDVKVGDWIKMFDEETGTIKTGPVEKTQNIMHDNVHELYLENGRMLRPTANHPFYTKNKGWATISGLDELGTGAGKLEVGDYLYNLTSDGKLEEVKVIDIVAVEGNYVTYNLIDTEYETFIAEDIVVHNSPTPTCNVMCANACTGYTGDTDPCPAGTICTNDPYVYCSASCEDNCLADFCDPLMACGFAYGGCVCTAPPPDTDPPTPNPPDWDTIPYETSSSSISMEVDVCTDAYPSNPVQYVIREESGNPGWSDKGWNTVRTHTDDGLSENTQYSYRCRARDAIPNYGSFSALSYEYTDIDPPLPGDFDLGTEITSASIKMIIDPEPPNPTAGSTGVYFDFVSGGTGAADRAFSNTYNYNDTGLQENVEYTYRAKFRNGDANDDNEYCNSEAVYTYANPPTGGQLDVADYGDTWILWRLVDVDNNPDAGITDGYFDIVTNPGGGSSGLSTSDDATYYYFNDTGLTAGQEYGMKARYDNYDGVDTTYCSEVKQTTAAPSNNAPYQSGEVPANTSNGVSLTPDLYVLCTDADGDNMNATWWSNSSSSWVQFASNSSGSGFANNTNITQTNNNFSNYNKTYYWSVNLTDGNGGWNNETYHFTTKADDVPPAINFTEPPTPANNTETEDTYAVVNVTVSDNLGNVSSFIDWNQSLRGYWSMDYMNSTGVYDNSTYDNFANFTGSDFDNTNQTTGIYGDALEFDGDDDYLSVNDHSSLDITSEITIEAWVKDPPLIPSNNAHENKDSNPEIIDEVDDLADIVSETSDSNKNKDVTRNIFVNNNFLGIIRIFGNQLNKYALLPPFKDVCSSSSEEPLIEEDESVSDDNPSINKEESLEGTVFEDNVSDENCTGSIQNNEKIVDILDNCSWYKNNILRNIGMFNLKKFQHNELTDISNEQSSVSDVEEEPENNNSSGVWVKAVISPPYENISVSETKELIDTKKEDVVLVDVRTTGEYLIDHIDGSVSLPLYKMLCGNCTRNTLDEYKDYMIIVYDDNGSRSEQACYILYGEGFENVYNMSGGIKAWKDAEYSIWENSAADKGLTGNISDSLNPIIVSAYVEPTDVWPGDIMLVSAEIKDYFGISSVIADMGGIETIKLENVKGNIYQGIWQKKWLVHDTEVRGYITNITVTNLLGKQTTSSINWTDDMDCRLSPTGYNDPSSGWTYETRAYDNNDVTNAEADDKYITGWTSFLELTRSSSLDCDEIRINAWYDSEWCYDMDIDVYSGTTWYSAWAPGSGSWQYPGWEDISITERSITKARVRFYVKGYIGGTQAYVNEFDFGVAAPEVSTDAATNVEETTATLNGDVDDDKEEPVEYQFQYGYSGSYGFDTGTNNDDADPFDEEVTGLNSGDLVYYRAQLRHEFCEGGTDDAVSGNQQTFMTKPPAPTSLHDTSETDDCISYSWTECNPDGSGQTIKTMIRASTSSYPTDYDEGTQWYFSTGESETQCSLNPDTKYYVSAFGYTEEGGKSEYSDTYDTDLMYTEPGGPSSLNAYNPSSTTIDLTWSKGSGSENTMIRYKTSGYPTSESDGTQAYFDTGTSTQATGLTPGQIYYFRAWAYGSTSGYYSDGYSSDSEYTLPGDPSGLDAKNPTSSSIDLEWTKGTGGDKTVIRRATGSAPTSPTSGYEVYNNTGTTHTDSDGLSSGVTYYYSAWAYDSDSGYFSDGYCSDSETTTLDAPTVTTNAASSVEETTATINGNIDNTGGENPTRYMEWDTDGAPFDNSADKGAGGTGAYSHDLTSLSKGTRYHFRAYATNTGGTGYGSSLTFRTKPDPPGSLGANAINKTVINLSWSKGDGAYHTVIIRKAGSAPSSRSDGAEIYNDTGTNCSDTGLNGFTTYHYRAWSITNTPDQQYSDTPDQTASATTWSPKTIIAKGDAYQLAINGTTLYGYINDKEINTTIDEEWHHVALTYNGSTMKLYVDGNLNASDSYSQSIGENNNDLTMGSDLTGELDEVRVWSRALTWEEINVSYNASSISTYEHNFSGLSYGNYSYYAYAIDRLGNHNSTETRYFNVTAGENHEPENGVPTLNNFDDSDNCYAKHKWYNITVVYTDTDGYADFNYVEMRLNQSSEDRAIFRYTEATDTFSQVDGRGKFDFNTTGSVAIKSGNTITVHWHFMPDWDADEESDVNITCYCIDDNSTSDLDITDDQFDVITNLLASSIECVTPNDNDNPDRVSVSASLTVNFSVRYADDPSSSTASSSYPPNDEFNSVSVRDSAGANQSTDSSITAGDGSCSFSAPSSVGSDNYTLWINMVDVDYTDGEEATPKEWIITDRIEVTNIVVTDYSYDDGSRYWDVNSPITLNFTAIFDYDDTKFDGNLTVGYLGDTTAWGNTTISGSYHIATPNDYSAGNVVTRDDVTAGAVVNGSYNITAITVSATEPEVGWDGKGPTCGIEYNRSATYFKSGDTLKIFVNFSTEGGTGINESTANITIATQGDGDLSETLLSKTDSTHWYYNWTIPGGSDEDGNFTVSITAKDNVSNALNPDPTNDTSKYIDNTAPTFSSWAQDQDTDSGGDGYDPRAPSGGTGYEDDDNCSGDFSGCTDGGSGIAYYYIKRDGGSYGPSDADGGNANCTLTAGWNYIHYKIVDDVGNEATGNTTDKVYYGTTNPSNFDMDITESSEHIYIEDPTDIVGGTLYYNSAQYGNFSIAVDADGSADWGSGGAWKVNFSAGFDESAAEDDSSPYASSNYEINGASTTSLTVTIVNNCSWLLNLTLTTTSNSPPTLSGETPTNESTEVSTGTSTINVTITDADGDTVNWTIETGPDVGNSSWTDAGQNNSCNYSKNCSVSGLSGDVTYYWYVNVTDGMFWTNATYHFTTETEFTVPTVVTNASTGVEETNATLWGYLSSNGSADTTCGFRYGTSSGSYPNNITHGIVANGTEFSNDTTGLTQGQIYFYQAWANNSAGFANGSEQVFLTKPEPPSSLTAQTNSSSVIYLTWNTGTGYNTTYIERNQTGITVWARGAGTEVYNDTGTYYEDTGLTAGTTYYYQAWSFANWTYNPTLHQWSDDNASASNTTNNVPVLSNESPTNVSTGVALNPTLEIQVNHSNGYQMNISWYWGTDSSCPNLIGSNTSVNNGTYQQDNDENFSQNSQTYYWKVTVNDGHGEWTNETYHFTTIGANKEIISKGQSAYSLEINPAGTTLYGYVNGTSVSTSIDTNWHYVALTYDGGNLRLYVDGSLNSTTPLTGAIPTNSNNLTLGEYLTGTLDEIRVSNTARDAAGINTTYLNTNSPTTFATFGTQKGILTTWSYRKKIWINASMIDTDLTNFPVLISTTDTDLKNNALSNGSDILFTNSSVSWTTGSHTDKLAHEIERYTSATGELVAWVNVTSLSSTTNTTIYMYYGNSLCTANRQNITGVWDSNFTMVQHLNETSDPHEDSTSNNNDGNESGGVNQSATGKIDGADWFDGSNDQVSVSDSSSLDITGQITLEAWINDPFKPQSLGLTAPQVNHPVLDKDSYEDSVSGLSNTAEDTSVDESQDSPQQIGYKFLNDNKVLHIWNEHDSYYFNTSSWLQLTNHYEEYWTHNVLMLGYYSGDKWNPIYQTDKLHNYNRNITTDKETYVNVTLWKDLTYNGYDFRLSIKYHLGVNDSDLTVIPYIKNLGNAIPYELIFGWEIKDIQIDMTPENDRIEINGTSYYLNETLDNTYKNMTNPIFYVTEDKGSGKQKSLYLKWNENLDHEVQVISRDSQYNAPVTLFIKVGTLNVDQEKSTELYWHDADTVIYYFNDYDDGGEEWEADPEKMVDGTEDGSYAFTNNDDEVELLTVNNCPGTNLGTISKVELQAYGYIVTIIVPPTVLLRPVFAGGDGANHDSGVPQNSGDWGDWIDITTDNNAPSPWTWSAVQNLDCDVEFDGAGNARIGEVQIRVTYTPPVAGKKIVSKTRNAYDLSINGSTLYGYINGNEVNTSIDETWRHVVLTYDGSNIRLYVDGTLNASDSLAGAINTNSNVISIGSNFSGEIDEVRISNTARNASWINASFKNQNDTSNFTAFGSQEIPNVAPTQSSPSPSNGDTGQSLNPTLSITVNDTNIDAMNVTFHTNATGTWGLINYNDSVYNGTYSQTNSSMDSYNITYWWSVNVSDGTTWTNQTYSFTTTTDWWNTNWDYRKLLTIDSNQVPATLTNFPILVYNSSDSDLSSNAQPDGDDICFVLYSDNTTKLNHEIENYTSGTGALVAWVNVTSISSTTDTLIWMYYGNSTCGSQENIAGTWDVNYTGVWHLNDDYLDSTSNNYDGTNSGSTNSTGKIGGADYFDGSSHIYTASNPGFGTGPFTVEAWYKGTQDAAWKGIAGAAVSGVDGIAMLQHSGELTSWINADVDIGPTINNGFWQHCAMVRNGGTVYLYLNGSESSFATSALTVTNAQVFWIGGWGDTSNRVIGDIDEVRLSNTVRSASWITTCYNTMTNTTTFISYGSEVSQ